MNKTTKSAAVALTIVLALALATVAFAGTIRVLLGDVNGDGVTNTGDAVMVLRQEVGMLTFDSLQMVAADANQNGDVNTGDATHILRITVGLAEEQWIEVDDGEPTTAPTTEPTTAPTTEPTTAPTTEPTTAPTTEPTTAPTTEPTTAPTTEPTTAPTEGPTNVAYTVKYVFGDKENLIREVTGSAPAGAFEYTALSPVTMAEPDEYGTYRGFLPNEETYNFTLTAGVENVFKVFCREIFTNESNRNGMSWATAYILRTVSDLNMMRNYMSAYFVLGADIDMSGIDWYPVGNYNQRFFGHLDGNGYTISNLTITAGTACGSNQSSYAGFIGSLSEGEVKNLTIVKANINIQSGNGTRMFVGIAVASSHNSEVTNCYTSGTVFQRAGAGGTGGVVGTTWRSGDGGTDSSKTGFVKGCSSSATISSTYTQIGGIIGATNMPITECWFNGTIDCTVRCVGGIVGFANGSTADYRIENCWTSGSIAGTHNNENTFNGVGGIVGWGSAQGIQFCYSTARVNSVGIGVSTTAPYCQPMVGRSNGAMKDLYYLKGNFFVNGSLNVFYDTNAGYANGSGLTLDIMKISGTYFMWDTTIWNIVNGQLPELISNPNP